MSVTTASLGLRRPSLGNQRRFLSIYSTLGLFLLAYLFGILSFPAMRDGQAFMNLFNTTPFLLICAVGETFVILTGGIDLSVSGIVALTTVATAALLQMGWDPRAVILLMLLMGVTFGLVMGVFIAYLKVQPFIATLAGMWLARGLCYIISDNEIRIYDPTWKVLAGTKVLIPGMADPVTKTGAYLSLLVLVALAVLAVALFLAHFTSFGRTAYAIGGSNGANEISARLMGLKVDRTKVGVYVLSGFCSALAGLAYSIYVGSGHGTHAWGFELTVIAAVVIGGIALTGGEGYLIGALFGVLVTALIQSLIQFNGELSSWWTSIAIGSLMLLFIGVQSFVQALSAGRTSRAQVADSIHRAIGSLHPPRTMRSAGISAAAVVVVLLIGGELLLGGNQVAGGTPDQGTGTSGCTLNGRNARVDQYVRDGAVIAIEKSGGNGCIDELSAVYADGRVVSDNGTQQKAAQLTAAQVEALVGKIANYGWFTPDMYTTFHTPCSACYAYYTTVLYKGVSKGIGAVDGGTDAPANYWLVYGELAAVLPAFQP